MRDVLVIMLVFLGAALALKRPSIGILFWTWVSIMNPHRLAWTFAEDFPVAAVIGGATLIGLFITKEKKNYFITPPSAALMLFMLWIIITYPFSINVDGSTDMLMRVLKIDFMVLIALIVIHSKQQILYLVWAIIISLGFYGIKGGIFTLLTGGHYRVWGPEASFIAGNNEIALALIICIPLMYFMLELSHKRWLRIAWLGAMSLTAIAAIGTQSRGAFLAITAMLALLWLRGRQKLMIGILLIGGAILILNFMPEKWHLRMDTIENYRHDASAIGRLNAWKMTWNLANDKLFGGGFDIYTLKEYARYLPHVKIDRALVAHSIYFQVLGEHGFVGLALFLIMWALTWRWAGWLRRNAGHSEETRWASILGSMCQVSMIGYAVGGAFLSLAYFDLPYDILVLVVVARRWVEAKQKEVEAKAAESDTVGAFMIKDQGNYAFPYHNGPGKLVSRRRI